MRLDLSPNPGLSRLGCNSLAMKDLNFRQALDFTLTSHPLRTALAVPFGAFRYATLLNT